MTEPAARIDSEHLRYPIGAFSMETEPATPAARARRIEEISRTPENLRRAVAGLSPDQLNTPYRPEGWTIRQVAHHLPDSHANAYIRFKLGLTEDDPVIKPYDQSRWAALPDSRDTPIEISLSLLDFLHQRWCVLLESLSPSDFERRVRHPEAGLTTLDRLLATYAWHGRHHVAHITSSRERMKWS